jgi:hypothetical protein
MGAEPAAKSGAVGLKDTAESPPAPMGSDVADPAARRPRLNTFRRLARFSTLTRRWHSVDRVAGEPADLPAVVPPRAGDGG